MKKENKVYIGVSLDGYIADRKGQLDFLESVAIPEGTDMGYQAFMDSIDALVMGRNTFESVSSFDMDWPYTKPVFVLSNTLKSVPEKLQEKVFLINGTLNDVLNNIHNKGFHNLYIDGGKTIQSFLAEDLIDEIIITTIPVLIGGGVSLFGDLPNHLQFELINTEVFADHIIQRHYNRKKHTP